MENLEEWTAEEIAMIEEHIKEEQLEPKNMKASKYSKIYLSADCQ